MSLRGESNDRREFDSTKQSHFEGFAARTPEIASLDSSGPEIAPLRPAISSSQ